MYKLVRIIVVTLATAELKKNATLYKSDHHSIGVVATLSIGVTEKKWRAPGFREGRLRELVNSPYQPSQRKFSGTHTGVERPVEVGLALEARRARVVDSPYYSPFWLRGHSTVLEGRSRHYVNEEAQNNAVPA
jgi:hypothetical protein